MTWLSVLIVAEWICGVVALMLIRMSSGSVVAYPFLDVRISVEVSSSPVLMNSCLLRFSVLLILVGISVSSVRVSLSVAVVSERLNSSIG